MYYKFLIISLHVSITLAISNSSISSVELINVQNATYSEPDGAVKFENSVAADEHESNFKWLVCSTFPGICSRLASFTRRLFHFGAFEGRGPKDLIAIVSTMLAALLGAILVKLNVLIVLSLISVGIGKLLVLILTLKSHLFAGKTQQPVVYEKVYYPHREYVNQMPQSYHDEYSTYNLSR